MMLNGDLFGRPAVSVDAVELFSRKNPYGGVRNHSEMTPVSGLFVAIGTDVL
jgi:hypothetical protein